MNIIQGTLTGSSINPQQSIDLNTLRVGLLSVAFIICNRLCLTFIKDDQRLGPLKLAFYELFYLSMPSDILKSRHHNPNVHSYLMGVIS